MATKRKSSTSPKNPELEISSGRNRLLALSLVPFIAGVVFILAWAIDWELISPMDNQAYLGLLFILSGFALANLFQKKWLLFAGWSLITAADLLLLTKIVVWVQVAALVLAAAGLALLGVAFFQQFQKYQAQR